MASYLVDAIIELAARYEPRGVPMGVIVDTLAGEGFEAASIESEIWGMLGRRRLTPCGYVCRKVRRRDETGELVMARTYEFLLVPWSPDMDRQLDLDIAAAPEDERQ
jgi:hypothetical protein